MLKMNKTVTISGTSQIDGRTAETFNATIDSVNPENMNMSSYISDSKTYRDNHTQCEKDAAEFRTKVFEIQDEMIAEKAALKQE